MIVTFDESGASPGLLALQAASKRILARFLAFCSEHDLTAFLVAGSALGSVRHGDIIPWDDDIDVGMPRADYERFVALFAANPDPDLFLQTHAAEPSYPLPFAKLRLKHTAVDEAAFRGTPIRSGIYIDIFPFDTLPRSPVVRLGQWLMLAVINAIVMSFSLHTTRVSPLAGVRAIRGVLLMARRFIPVRPLIALRERVSARPCGPLSGQLICFEMYGLRGAWRTRAPREDLLPVSPGRLGDLYVPLPAAPSAYLQRVFGDWKRMPPPDKRHPIHIRDVSFESD